MKILHLITDLQLGGESHILLELLPALNARGFENVLCCLTANLHQGRMRERDLIGEFRGCGVRTHNLEASGRSDLGVVWRLARLLRRERPDILHTYLFHANVMGRMVGRILGVPRVVSSVVSIDDWKRWHHSAAERLTSLLADRILVNAGAIRDVLVGRDGIAERRIRVLYNGVDATRFEAVGEDDGRRLRDELGYSAGDFVVAAIGRLHKAKGLEHLLEAVARAAAQEPACRLLLVGDGPERARLEALGESLGISPRVRFAGARRDVPAILKMADVLVVSSLWEGIPATILEGMAARTPVVATAVGGIPEVVRQEETGLLVPPADAGALASALLRIRREGALAERMAQAARAQVRERFRFDRNVIEERAQFYQELRGEP